MTTAVQEPAFGTPPPLRPLYITSGVATAFVMVYTAASVQPVGLTGLFIAYAPIISLVMWLRADARARRIGVVFDWGFLALVTWPILVPWYAFRTRRRGGWLLLGKVALALVSPWIGAFLVLIVQSVFGAELPPEAGA
jgi:hypothetical protein